MPQLENARRTPWFFSLAEVLDAIELLVGVSNTKFTTCRQIAPDRPHRVSFFFTTTLLRIAYVDLTVDHIIISPSYSCTRILPKIISS
jgi:hypothetical protein